MENPQARAAVERGRVKETSSIQSGQHHLLVDFIFGVPLLLVGGQVVFREHALVDIIHFQEFLQ